MPGAPAVTAGKRRLCGRALLRLAAPRAGGNSRLAVTIAGRRLSVLYQAGAAQRQRIKGREWQIRISGF